MRVAVLPNYQAEGVKDVIAPLCDALTALGAEVCLPKDNTTFPPADCDSVIVAADTVVALGGDGTLIHAAKHAAPLDRAVLGVNCGHLGFMCGMESDDLPALSRLISGEYAVSSRMMLEVTLHTGDGDRVFHALNEAVLSRGALSRMIGVTVYNGGDRVVEYRADGVILATPTGSTAYSLSAGGPVIDPSVNCMLLTPICPHSLHTRSHIFSEDAVLTVRLAGEEREAFLTVDGEDGIAVKPHETITVRRSPYAARTLRLNTDSFYEVLTRKLTDR